MANANNECMTYYYRRGNKYFFKRGELKVQFETDLPEMKKEKRGEFRLTATYLDGSKKLI